MHLLLTITITALVAAFVTSFAEYKLNYNLFDLIKDKLASVFGRARAEEEKVQNEVHVHIQQLELELQHFKSMIEASLQAIRKAL